MMKHQPIWLVFLSGQCRGVNSGLLVLPGEDDMWTLMCSVSAVVALEPGKLIPWRRALSSGRWDSGKF